MSPSSAVEFGSSSKTSWRNIRRADLHGCKRVKLSPEKGCRRTDEKGKADEKGGGDRSTVAEAVSINYAVTGYRRARLCGWTAPITSPWPDQEFFPPRRTPVARNIARGLRMPFDDYYRGPRHVSRHSTYTLIAARPRSLARGCYLPIHTEERTLVLVHLPLRSRGVRDSGTAETPIISTSE